MSVVVLENWILKNSINSLKTPGKIANTRRGVRWDVS
jgi:hypothetical protein